MTLQPMTTAPRDGSFVWFAFEATKMSMVLAAWDPKEKCWISSDNEYEDYEFSGWLDIEALARDGERLELLYELAKVSRGGKIEIELLLDKSADWDGTTCLWDRAVFRAAIDKEMR